MTAGQLRGDGVRRERDTTDLPGAKNVADVSFTAPDGLPAPTAESSTDSPCVVGLSCCGPGCPSWSWCCSLSGPS
ncbi:MAG: hypothetical protein ACRDRX_23965 [Pseudonocardiaceae bacterium]